MTNHLYTESGIRSTYALLFSLQPELCEAIVRAAESRGKLSRRLSDGDLRWRRQSQLWFRGIAFAAEFIRQLPDDLVKAALLSYEPLGLYAMTYILHASPEEAEDPA